MLKVGIALPGRKKSPAPQTFNLTISGITFALGLPPHFPQESLWRQGRPFASPLPPEYHLEVSLGAAEFPGAGEKWVQVGNGNLRWRWGPSTAELDLEGRCGRVSLPSPDALYRPFLASLCSLLLLDRGGLLLHSSGLVRKGKALLFSGPSGAGKSTLLRLCGGPGLGEDVIALQRVNGRYHATATPFGPLYAHPPGSLGAPLGALFFLVQDKENFPVLLSPSQAAFRLMANSWLGSTDTPWVDKLFPMAERIAATVPAYSLHFQKDNSIKEVVFGLAGEIP